MSYSDLPIHDHDHDLETQGEKLYNAYEDSCGTRYESPAERRTRLQWIKFYESSQERPQRLLRLAERYEQWILSLSSVTSLTGKDVSK